MRGLVRIRIVSASNDSVLTERYKSLTPLLETFMLFTLDPIQC